MNNLKPFLQHHSSIEDAINRTRYNSVTAVVVRTYIGSLQSKEYFSYKTKWDGSTDLREDFPITLGSNQSIEEIDANDY